MEPGPGVPLRAMDRRAPPRGSWSPSRPPPHPVVLEAHHALQQRYRVRFDGCGFAWYRDGRDSVAFHRDRDLRWLDDTVIALVCLASGAPGTSGPGRRGTTTTRQQGRQPRPVTGSGDLIVMGGRTQTAWEHSVPKTDPRVGGRISLQWRWTRARVLRSSAGATASPFTSVADARRRVPSTSASSDRHDRCLGSAGQSVGAIENTSFGVPAAAHTMSLSRNAGSRNTRSSVAWPNGGTPPIGKPVAARAESASTRWVLDPPAARARASVAHCRSPGTRASTISSLPSGWITPNTSDFTI